MKNLIVLFISLLAFSGCTNQPEASPIQKEEMSEHGLIHTVYFWFPEDTTDERKKEFEQALVALSKVPSIDKFHWGPPAVTVERDVIDKSYDYAINVFFSSVEAEQAYQVDPIHGVFVETQKEIFEKVVVYNNLY